MDLWSGHGRCGSADRRGRGLRCAAQSVGAVPVWPEEPARPMYRAGRWDAGSVGVGLAAAGPDERVALAALFVEEVRVNRSVEARIVQLDREVVAAFAGALGPGGADLGSADIGAVARGVLV